MSCRNNNVTYSSNR